jgi:hypothetical protein
VNEQIEEQNINANIGQSASDAPSIVGIIVGGCRGVTTLVSGNTNHLKLRIRSPCVADNVRDRCWCWRVLIILVHILGTILSRSAQWTMLLTSVLVVEER